MSEISGDPARLYTLKLRINRRAEKTFVFTENDLAMDVSVGTWELFVKKYPGDKKKVISLTLGNGLEIPIYQDDRFVASFTSAHTKLEKGEYYFELVRTDIEKTYLNGICKVYFGPEDNAPDNDTVSVDVSNEDVNVSTLQDITILYNGTKVGTTKALNFVPGSNVTIDVQKVGEKINVTITSSGGGSSFTLGSGNGTTANGSAADLGGTLSENVVFNGAGYAIELSNGSFFVFATAGSSNGFDLSEPNSKFQLSSLPAGITDKGLYWNSATGEVTQGDPSGVYLGLYISLAALQSAHPTADSGQYAIVDPGSGTNAVKYIWDEDEGWVAGGGSGASVWGDLGGTLSDQTDLQNALNAKSDSLYTIRTTTGGHTLDSTDLAAINAGDLYIISNSGGGDLTIPTNATVAFSNGTGMGIRGFANIVATGGVTITGTRGDLTIPTGTTAVLEKTATNTWTLHNGSPSTAASETEAGVVELATTAETTTGTDTTRAVTPAGVKAVADLKANIASPTFTGTPAAPTAANGTNTTQVATTAFVNAEIASDAPAETTTTIGSLINGATAKTTPVDADFIGLMDSAASNILKKLSWANIKATLKTYFDTLYENSLERVTVSTAGSTITMDMNGRRHRKFVGSASFSTPKTIALSNDTAIEEIIFFFSVTDVNAELTMPSSFVMSDINFDGSIWTPPATGKFMLGGSYDGTEIGVFIAGPLA